MRALLRAAFDAAVGSGQGFLAGIRPLIVATLVMMVGTLVQIMLWGGLFLWLGEFEQAYDAIYHSAVNFTSLGYGDIVMSRERRLLGPLEAVNGVLMLGMSAATLMAIVQHMITLLRDARADAGLAAGHEPPRRGGSPAAIDPFQGLRDRRHLINPVFLAISLTRLISSRISVAICSGAA